MSILTTIYPYTGDGYVGRTSQASWAAARDNADGTVASYTGTTVNCKASLATTFTLFRCFGAFNATGQIPAENTIIGVSIVLTNVSASGLATDFVLFEGLQASESALVVGDFDAFGTTELATRVPFSTASVGLQTILQLNAAGLALFQRNGLNWYCIRTAKDVDNVAPGAAESYGGSFAAVTYSTVGWRWAMVVEHEAPAPPASISVYKDGTDGLTDGTALTLDGSSGSVATLITDDDAVKLHIRCSDGSESPDSVIVTPPSNAFEVSADNATWGALADIGVVGDVNVPVWIRQIETLPDTYSSHQVLNVWYQGALVDAA